MFITQTVFSLTSCELPALNIIPSLLDISPVKNGGSLHLAIISIEHWPSRADGISHQIVIVCNEELGMSIGFTKATLLATQKGLQIRRTPPASLEADWFGRAQGIFTGQGYATMM